MDIAPIAPGHLIGAPFTVDRPTDTRTNIFTLYLLGRFAMVKSSESETTCDMAEISFLTVVTLENWILMKSTMQAMVSGVGSRECSVFSV